jgi:hypothetical protein
LFLLSRSWARGPCHRWSGAVPRKTTLHRPRERDVPSRRMEEETVVGIGLESLTGQRRPTKTTATQPPPPLSGESDTTWNQSNMMNYSCSFLLLMLMNGAVTHAPSTVTNWPSAPFPLTPWCDQWSSRSSETLLLLANSGRSGSSVTKSIDQALFDAASPCSLASCRCPSPKIVINWSSLGKPVLIYIYAGEAVAS